MLSKRRILLVLFLLSCLLFSCKKKTDYTKNNAAAPNMVQVPTQSGLDFVEMHNFVIDGLQPSDGEEMPYIFIVNNSFDISGDNDKMEITVRCTCLDGCVLHDVDLFLSDVLYLMALNASEQSSKYKAPTVLNDGTHADFGTVFNSYDLRLFVIKQSGEVLEDVLIKKGEQIPVDPRYIREV